MRLDIVNRILLENKLNLKFINDSNGKVVFNGLNTLRDKIETIEKTGTFKNEISKIKNTDFYKVKSDTIIVVKAEATKINAEINQFNNLITNLHTNLSLILGEEQKNVLYIKLPETTDLNNISDNISILEKVINQIIVNDQINGQIEFLGVQTGSSWLKIGVGTSIALSTIAGCFWSATIILQKMEELNQMQEQTKTLIIKNDNLEDLRKYRNSLFDTSLEIEAQRIANDTLTTVNNDEIERLKYSIKTFTELINKGIEIQPALNEPIDVQQLFPQNENYKLLNNIKLLK